jgi:phospholipid transport system substrate-binding protein
MIRCSDILNQNLPWCRAPKLRGKQSKPARSTDRARRLRAELKQQSSRDVRRWIQLWILVLIFTFATAATSTASDQVLDPALTIKATVADAITILHNQSLPVEQRRRELRDLAERNLDLKGMARESIGQHWAEMSAAEQEQFVGLFAAFIEEAYLAKIQNYAELNIAVTTTVRRPSSSYAEVHATVQQPHEEDLPIVFFVERRGNDWLVYDVGVGGVSMIHNYGAQFDRVIKDHGLEQLLADLRAKEQQLQALIAPQSG